MATNISIPTYGFVNHILALNEGNWRRFFKPFITDSVQSGLATIAGANMTVYVSAGECRCGAVMGILDEMVALDVANGDSTYDRIDSVIVQYTYGEPSTLAVAIVQGTPSANPVPPTLTKVYDTLWQMEIAQILVPSGATSSSEFTITDKRVIYESIESIIDDNTESEERVWSSQKSREEIVSLSTEIYDSLNTKADVIERTVSGDIVTITDGGNNLPVKELVVDIDPVQAGTGDPSPDNVRPITGWTSATVTRTGKNLWNSSDVLNAYIEYSSPNKISASDTTRTVYVSVVSGQTYTISKASGARLRIGFTSQTPEIGVNCSNFVVADTLTRTVTVPSGSKYLVAYCVNTGEDADAILGSLQVELGSSATSYEPYQGQSVTIDLNGTRYGGVLDVLTGTMTVDRVKQTSGTITNMYNAGNNRRFRIGLQNTVSLSKLGACNILKFVTESERGTAYTCYVTSTNNFYLDLPASLFDTIAKAQTFVDDNGLEIVYPLATPLTVQLSPSKIQTLLGTNNIFANTGNILNLTYRADMKTYVDEHVAEANLKTRQMMTTVTTKMVAPNNLVIGDIVIVNDDLYKVINSNIASGASMVVGTNVEQITLTEYIQSLI